MENYRNIKFTCEKKIAHLKLDRPEVCNAFDENLIADVRSAIATVKKNVDIRALVISGGKHFCAGGDISWMKRQEGYDYDKHYDEMYQISCMFDDIYTLKIPTIAQVNGAAIGGGVGFVAACDIVVASDNSIFSLSETKSGLVPACITYFLVHKVSSSALRRYFITGEKFNVQVAKDIGLVHEICAPKMLDKTVDALCETILECAPNAVTMAKELLFKVPNMDYQDFLKYGAEMVTQMRMSEEGREGFLSFMEKRKPLWVTKK